jgi:hypothetical protein
MQKKMSLAKIQGKPSRAEMKNIMAGSRSIDCKKEWDTCSAAQGDKCCDGLVCANYLCQIKTEQSE